MDYSTSVSRVGSTDHKFISPATKRQAVQSLKTSAKMDVAANDDERERRERRRSKVTDLQLSGTESPLMSPVSRGTPQSFEPKLSNNQISEHYSTCIKLCSENKITTKNAFGLHLIDYMADLLKEKESELTNFKMAAGTLDASTKIYAVRVDAVHSDVFRILGGLGKNTEEPGTEVNPESSEGQNSKGPQKQNKRKHSYKTIEQNLSNITYGVSDMKFEIDPMFQKAASLFDECSAVGVFMVNLQTYGHTAELLFDSDAKLIDTGPPPELLPIDQVEISDLGGLQQSLDDKKICPSLEDFQFTNWDSEAHNQAVSLIMEKFKKSDHLFDMNAEPEFAHGQLGSHDPVVDDFDGDLCDDAGDLMHQDFENQQESSIIANGQGCKETIPLSDVDFNSLCVQLSNHPGEYSYFSPRIMKMWAGPNHWRFRPQQKEPIANQNKKKQAKKIFEIDFNEDINFEIQFRETRAATTISKAALDRRSRKLTTLPTDFHYDPDNITRLFLKPSVTVKRIVKENICTDQDDGIADYDYNNPNDTSNFCPRTQPDSDDDHDGFVAANDSFDAALEQDENGLELDGKGLNITTYGGENLVAEPQKVNKILLNYSKTAKKMDVKRLKQNMWDLLTENKNITEGKNGVTEELQVAVMTVKGQQSFTNITKNLFERLPSTMAKNLSVPMAFACLLHLANEKNLAIEGKEDLSDVIIRQGI
ncbi:condensin complex subunit 2 [Chiloscyllium plagiosum]|uniref:condensin complex subunit 2 n=1 Tax=Chiloscyllium plagiosum TaxID=36176 RepID=UPI001CB82647|nr:condensin complex subunit 2 [Chiloscyllium plagiosum]XP_043537272.1 condensin complex subunit 2 [Chiloscyllium plagiosum]